MVKLNGGGETKQWTKNVKGLPTEGRKVFLVKREGEDIILHIIYSFIK
jgi:hypothetical protein